MTVKMFTVQLATDIVNSELNSIKIRCKIELFIVFTTTLLFLLLPFQAGSTCIKKIVITCLDEWSDSNELPAIMRNYAIVLSRDLQTCSNIFTNFSVKLVCDCCFTQIGFLYTVWLEHTWLFLFENIGNGPFNSLRLIEIDIRRKIITQGSI